MIWARPFWVVPVIETVVPLAISPTTLYFAPDVVLTSRSAVATRVPLATGGALGLVRYWLAIQPVADPVPDLGVAARHLAGEGDGGPVGDGPDLAVREPGTLAQVDVGGGHPGLRGGAAGQRGAALEVPDWRRSRCRS